MKVKIIKPFNNPWWNDVIGETFEVYYMNGIYHLSEDSMKYTRQKYNKHATIIVGRCAEIISKDEEV